MAVDGDVGNSGFSLFERPRRFHGHKVSPLNRVFRGGIHGCDLDDWLQAERELQEKYNKSNDGGKKKK